MNIIGRATQGVRLINLDKRNDEIASVCKVISEKEEEIITNKSNPDITENEIEEQQVKENTSLTDFQEESEGNTITE